jgi:sugar lactone lactonase YvrE
MSHRQDLFRCVFCLLATIAAKQGKSKDLDYPISVAVAPSGTVYLADRNLPGVWRWEGGRLSLYHQASRTSRSPLSAIRCLAVDAEGRLLAGDSGTRELYRFESQDKLQPLTAAKPLGQVGIPMAIAIDPSGDLLVSDLEEHRVVKVPKDGGPARPFAAIRAPRGICLDPQSRLWAISGRRLVRVTAEGRQEVVVEDGVFGFPHTVVVDRTTAYVCDGYLGAIWRLLPGKSPEKWASGPPMVAPVGMAIGPNGLLVADPRAKGLFEIDLERGLVEPVPLRLEATVAPPDRQ